MPHPHGSRSTMGLNSAKKNTVLRLLSYLKNYKLLVVLDMIAITLTALSNVLGMTYLEVIVDDYVKPLLLVDNPDFSGLLGVILQMAAVFGVGVVTSLFQGIFMARVAQGVQKKNPRRHVLPHAAAAHQVLRHPHLRRRHELLHQRRRYPPADALPEHSPDRLQPGDDCDRIHHHAGHQPHPDALRHCPACC